jgi:serine/threonine protein kinase
MSAMTTDSGARIDPHQQFVSALVGTTIAGRYRVERVLGKGGMGIVVVGRHPDLDQEVAIKVMFPEHAANGVLAARFMREARVAAKVKSPHLVRVSDVGKLDSGVPYLVMELLAGHDLDHELAHRGPLPAEDAVEIILQALTGIAELHAQGIVHRDLKPSNLFMTEDGALKVLDFGISKDPVNASGGLTVTDSLIGTPSHMSPEQIKTPKEVDPRADIWSLGVILYELVTRRMPFDLEGESVGELFGHILFSEPTPPRSRRPEVSEALDAVIMKCLRRERAERFEDVGELAEALRPLAPASSRHRVDAIKKALANKRPPPSPSDPRLPSSEEKATVASGKPPRVEVRAEVVVPEDSDAISNAVLGATAVAGSKSLATSTRSVTLAEEEARAKRSKTMLVAIVAAGALAVGAVLFVAYSKPTGTIASETPPVVQSASSAPTVAPSASEISTAIVIPPAPSASASVARVRPAMPVVVPPKPRPSATAAAPKPPGELILDRK